MNRIGAKSNTGEGVKMNNVTIYYKMEIVCVPLLSRLPSGRFGVTSRYLAEAEEIQIKMAQGAKPEKEGNYRG